MQTRTQKEDEVARLKQAIEGANALLLVDYRGLSVSDANDLRGRLRQVGEGAISYRVAKNNLIKRAIEGTPVAPIEGLLSGPTALAFSYDEPAVLAKTLVDYAKDNELLEIKGGVIEGELVDLDAIRRLAALPTKDELRGMLAGTLQAPLRNLAGTLHGLLGHVRNALEQRQAQLEAQ
jgi:large subunit ribosomal protein L10